MLHSCYKNTGWLCLFTATQLRHADYLSLGDLNFRFQSLLAASHNPTDRTHSLTIGFLDKPLADAAQGCAFPGPCTSESKLNHGYNASLPRMCSTLQQRRPCPNVAQEVSGDL
ncbi:uncharacterized protein C8Q71DRAFT_444221 [Rhodofomes roseus]|uniref:Uncharacterized protein n=1 Tax=Rhodofomes roseus TaxID=34475 RepID=A0ABQ8JYA5_9APHY|nr:uncharacterized protein C8Q71DRAFT_444221 [Rhodofomes roseus]KAH9829246.1 hypothetical protein C8Q71DRAFT_444221 [Rhodofomes roseus]